ncbi:MAG: phosphoserine phosphatase SerB [Proteobacteria bacterium]|nr:phosphoserine phosphatase SerB [Pseudomonadota bacterium]
MSLVLQGPGADAAFAHSVAGGDAVEEVAERVFRVFGAPADADLAARCAKQGVDFARVPEDRRLADLKLLAIDMDSTLITIECIDEIGAHVGRKEEIAALTEAAMQGGLGYAESLARRVALLEGLGVSALEAVYRDTLRLSPGADRLIERCRALGIRTLLVSGGFTFFTDRLRERLGIDATLSNELDIVGGRLTGKLRGPIVDAAAKAARLRAEREALGVSKAAVLAVGDGANDLLMMAEARVSVGWRAKAPVREAATHVLDYADLDGVLNLYA